VRDAKIKPLVETFHAEVLDLDRMICDWVLARAHSKVSGRRSYSIIIRMEHRAVTSEF